MLVLFIKITGVLWLASGVLALSGYPWMHSKDTHGPTVIHETGIHSLVRKKIKYKWALKWIYSTLYILSLGVL